MDAYLKIQHLAPYLPYGLKITACETPIDGLCGNKVFVDDGDSYYWISDITPILRPLSDLWKEEFKEHTEELSELDLEYIEDSLLFWSKGIMPTNKMLVGNINFDRVQFLISKHYDIYGLIDKKLAIDINTL